MDPLDQHFQQFLRERIYLHNVTPKTAEWYRNVWHVFQRWWATLPISERSRAVISRADLQEFVVHLRERGVKPVSCNCYLRGLNALGRWLHREGRIPQPVRLPPLKLEKRLLAIHNERALRLILSYRPKTFVQWRVHAVACTILDAGCRIDELLSSRVDDFDFDNLLLTVVGKGRKQRRVPISIELRKLRFRFGQVKERARLNSDLIFPAREGVKWENRNARRSYYCLLKRLGLAQSGFHLLRHTFATQYLRNGGDVVRLSIVLGHSEVSTTMKYLHLLTEDLQRPHQSLSILNRLR
jgi:integrase/recombinase XerD